MTSRLTVDNLRGAIVGPVSLAVAAGRCATISGPSGAGKSLLLRMIADLVPSEGEVRLEDRFREAMPAPAWRRQVVYAAAEVGWWDERVAVHFPAGSLPRARAQGERLGLGDGYFERPVATLSRGESQRLALVRALAHRPKVLLLDEPTSALDPESTERVEALLRDIVASGTIVLLVTHDVAQGRRLGAARYTMTAGRLAPA